MAKKKKKEKTPLCLSCGRPMYRKKRIIMYWGFTKVRLCEDVLCPDYMNPTKTIPPIFKATFKGMERLRGGGIIARP